MNIGNLITRHAQYRPQHLALVFEDQRLSYAQFNRRINRLANAMLGLGIQRGQRVATLLPNCIELLDIYWAAAKLGVTVVPLSPMLMSSGLLSLLADSDAMLLFSNAALRPVVDQVKADLLNLTRQRCILCGGASAGDLAVGYLDYAALTDASPDSEPPAVDLRGDEVYNIMYTSGTTGIPKGIVLTHQVRAISATLAATAFRIAPESVILHTGSLVFNGSFTTLLACAYVGATYVLHRQFDVEALIDTVRRERVTHTMLVPSQIIATMASAEFKHDALQSLEMLLSLGAPLHTEHKEKLQQALPDRFYELYGLTEGFFTILDRDDAIRKRGSVGVPLPFSELRILRSDGSQAAPREIGEIAGRSPILMSGYLKRPDLTAAAIVDGWLHSGDMGYVDEDGYLYLVDRMKDMIDSGGVKVYPRDIEEILVQHPLVKDVAVFGIPHDRWGEAPVAAVMLKSAGSIESESLKDWINLRVAARYQRVQEVVIMADFPRSSAGKTLKRELREPYWAGRETRI